MDRIEGGSILPITDFWVGGARHGHTAEQEGAPVSRSDLRATNHLQRTSWRINQGVLDVLQRALASGTGHLGFDAGRPPKRAERIPDTRWVCLTPEERVAVIEERRRSQAAIKHWQSAAYSALGLISAAHADREPPELFIPYGHDARLRRYPLVSSCPSPQGNGMSRALLMFAEGVPLGSRGLYWLAVRAATCAGLDKLTHDARAQWASDNTEAIRASARDPLGCSWWMDGRDDPWGLLATCTELDMALSQPSPGDFHSHLPVNVDGTCNGLQHLSALGLDPVGAEATNLTNHTERQDIYQLVADSVAARVERDASSGLAVAEVWLGKVDRSVVKRGVMTTPYGVTARGLRDQLILDDMIPETDDVGAAADYLRDVMWSAIGEVVVAARNLMDWLQTVAANLAKGGLPFRWRTPTGSTIQQAYHPRVERRVRTSIGRIYLGTDVDRSTLKARKQALGAAPNFVHSFDAAHMALTILKGAERGITHWATIHDSYGTHAARMDTLARTLREEFVSIYEADWLTATYDFVRSYAARVEVPPPPVRGDFDIRQVLSSPWFFA